MLRTWAIAVLLLVGGCADPAPLSEREAATQMLAKYLATEVRPRTVLVISNPFTQQSGRPAEIYEFEKASLKGLRDGFGENVTVKNAFPELRPEALRDPSSVYVDPNTTTPLSFLVAENAFEKVLDRNRDCDLVISLIGLPLNLPSFAAWTKTGAPRFALLLPDWRMIGGREAILNAFKSGKLAAAVVRNPDATPTTPFLLVSRANIEELLAARPQLFRI